MVAFMVFAYGEEDLEKFLGIMAITLSMAESISSSSSG
jgi:hypothetical protein